jgi:hypothetical protein
MPIQIREIVVTATIDETPTKGQGSSSIKDLDQETRNQFIQECVDKVMQMLKQQARR